MLRLLIFVSIIIYILLLKKVVKYESKLLIFILGLLYLVSPYSCFTTVSCILYTMPSGWIIVGITSHKQMWSSIILDIIEFIFIFIANLIHFIVNYKGNPFKHKEFLLPVVSYLVIAIIIPTGIAFYQYFSYIYPDYNIHLFDSNPFMK